MPRITPIPEILVRAFGEAPVPPHLLRVAQEAADRGLTPDETRRAVSDLGTRMVIATPDTLAERLLRGRIDPGVSTGHVLMKARMAVLPYPEPPKIDPTLLLACLRGDPLETLEPPFPNPYQPRRCLRILRLLCRSTDPEQMHRRIGAKYERLIALQYGRVDALRRSQAKIDEALYFYTHGRVGDIDQIERNAYPEGTFLEDLMLCRLASDILSEEDARANQMALQGRDRPSLVDCHRYLLNLLVPFALSREAGLSRYDVLNDGQEIFHGFLSSCSRLLRADEPIQVNDIVLHIIPAPDAMSFSLLHSARVVHAAPDVTLVEGKSGWFDRPGIHRLETIPQLMYGPFYVVHRPLASSAAKKGRRPTFAEAGFKIPENRPPSDAETLAAAETHGRRLRELWNDPAKRAEFYEVF